MLSNIFIYLLQLDEEVQHSCESGFVFQDSQCTCQQLLSSNGTLCVKNCSELDEIEVNGTCSVKLLFQKTYAEDCIGDYGPGFNWDVTNQRCYCPIGVSCECKTKKCCNTSFTGVGYHWDGITCSCPAGKDCFCTSEFCCQKQNLHYINGKCDTCENALGTGYEWRDQGRRGIVCMCPSNCTCQTQLCCAQFSMAFKNGQCIVCNSLYTPISNPFLTKDSKFTYCGCDSNQQEYGSLQKASDTCTKCPELLNENKDGCLTCEAGFGSGYVWDNSQQTCVCPKQTICECKTALCCLKTLGTNYIEGKCQTCQQQYSTGAIIDQATGTCVCDNTNQYYGVLDIPSSKCHKCAEYYNKLSKSCITCDKYATGYIWSTKYNDCIYTGSNCKCDTLICCVMSNHTFDETSKSCAICDGIVTQATNTCTQCSEMYGPGYAWDSNQSTCYCPPGINCDCSTEGCCQQNATHFISGRCSHCLNIFGTGYDWDYEKNVCFCRNKAICQCTTDICCSSLDLNSHINLQSSQCECNKGFKFSSGICKRKNKTGLVVGLAVGIPLGVIAIIIISVLIVMKQKKQKENNQRDKAETVHIFETVPENLPAKIFQ
ncbi:Hypothetical_protein [Hexamita inflata]|uniref:Hypothetical_protein n=1 Tax=Hexamita inflata TaxID=28002 RepID=A0AA86PI37_9EUKA|nr:Hypothetical protein HINF_LOCUS5764 [Hexamita inflata]CAI9940065.1 Hypothetical protein HINF_LOCUS27710 [Hexamita inflata]